MNKIKFAIKNLAIIALIISSFIACDKDFATVGSDIIGENNFGVYSTKFYAVKAYTTPLEAVQTNNLPLNYLGVFDDDLYGKTTASFVSQIGTSLYSPEFGGEVATIDSVVMTIPYFSKRVSTNADGETIYALDSVFGNGNINLSIFRNDYFLNNIDPNETSFDAPLNYYSNFLTDNGTIDSDILRFEPIPLIGSEELTPNTITNFRPNNREIKLKKGEEITRLAPALRVKMDTDYWQERILAKEGDPVLSNASNFNNYFRGIYFEANSNDSSGSMALLNFGTAAANITIYYSKPPVATGGERTESTFVLTFNGSKVNFLTNDFILPIPQGDAINGDEKLFLKGAGGSNAVVDLFNSATYEDGNSPEFIAFKNKFVVTDDNGKYVKSKRLINEANLVFYVDQMTVVGKEPTRIYLYDLNNNIPIIDYFIDIPNATQPEISRTNHLGVLQRENNAPNGEGIKYKIKITEHIKNLLTQDSTNVKLGLAVSGNINLENTVAQYKVLTSDMDPMNKVPVSSILTPRGTVLYGNNTSDMAKKLQLEIFYTCISNDNDCDED